MNASVLLVGYTNDPQLNAVAHALRDRGAHIQEVRPDLAPYAHQFAWQEGQLLLDGGYLREFDAAFVRALPPPHPGEGAFASAADRRLDWESWFQLNGLQRDRSDTLLGALLTLERDATPIINAPSSALQSRRKPFQLEQIRAVGAPIPRSLVSNDPKAAQSFIERVGRAIAKPAGGGALTLDAAALTAEQLEAVARAPAIFQERIEGDDLRVMVLDGEVISSVAIELPKGTLDFRADTDYRSGRARYSEAPLPPAVAYQCADVTRRLGLRFGGIDIKRTSAGEFVFLECNNSPIYLDVERKMGHRITAALAEALLD